MCDIEEHRDDSRDHDKRYDESHLAVIGASGRLIKHIIVEKGRAYVCRRNAQHGHKSHEENNDCDFPLIPFEKHTHTQDKLALFHAFGAYFSVRIGIYRSAFRTAIILFLYLEIVEIAVFFQLFDRFLQIIEIVLGKVG